MILSWTLLAGGLFVLFWASLTGHGTGFGHALGMRGMLWSYILVFAAVDVAFTLLLREAPPDRIGKQE